MRSLRLLGPLTLFFLSLYALPEDGDVIAVDTIYSKVLDRQDSITLFLTKYKYSTVTQRIIKTRSICTGTSTITRTKISTVALTTLISLTTETSTIPTTITSTKEDASTTITEFSTSTISATTTTTTTVCTPTQPVRNSGFQSGSDGWLFQDSSGTNSSANATSGGLGLLTTIEGVPDLLNSSVNIIFTIPADNSTAKSFIVQDITFCAGTNYTLNMYINSGGYFNTSVLQSLTTILGPLGGITGNTLGSIAGCIITFDLNTHHQTFNMSAQANVSISTTGSTDWQHVQYNFLTLPTESSGAMKIGAGCPGLAGQVPGGTTGVLISTVLGTLNLGNVTVGVDDITLDYPYRN